jgi:hypothetical protein
MARSGVVVSTYLDPTEAAIIRGRAEEGDRSIAAELRRIVRRDLQNAENPAGGPGSRSDQGVEGAASDSFTG